MKKSEEIMIRKELHRLAERLRNENEALLKLVREINAAGDANTLRSFKDKPIYEENENKDRNFQESTVNTASLNTP
jgi:hypothetical protein